jgi:hypothetical protein
VVQLLFDDACDNTGPLAPRQLGGLVVRRQGALHSAAVSDRAGSLGSDHTGNTDPAANIQASGVDRLSRDEPPMLPPSARWRLRYSLGGPGRTNSSGQADYQSCDSVA